MILYAVLPRMAARIESTREDAKEDRRIIEAVEGTKSIGHSYRECPLLHVGQTSIESRSRMYFGNQITLFIQKNCHNHRIPIAKRIF